VTFVVNGGGQRRGDLSGQQAHDGAKTFSEDLCPKRFLPNCAAGEMLRTLTTPSAMGGTVRSSRPQTNVEQAAPSTIHTIDWLATSGSIPGPGPPVAGAFLVGNERRRSRGEPHPSIGLRRPGRLFW